MNVSNEFVPLWADTPGLPLRCRVCDICQHFQSMLARQYLLLGYGGVVMCSICFGSGNISVDPVEDSHVGGESDCSKSGPRQAPAGHSKIAARHFDHSPRACHYFQMC